MFSYVVFLRYMTMFINKVVVILLNWVSPSTVKAQTKETQAAMVSMLCAQAPEKTAAIVLTPEFVYKRGNLWLAESAALKQLAAGHVNVDNAFTLTFREKVGITKFHEVVS